MKFKQLTNRSFTKDVTTHKELWEKAKEEGYDAFQLEVFTIFQKKAGSENRFRTVFSTPTEDRHGDAVKQNFELKSYKNNPVLIDSHNYNSIEHIIGRVDKISVKDQKLQGYVEFALDNPKGMLAFKLAEGGFLNTTSIGFIPKEFDEKGNISNSELLEISCVSVPANPEALIEKIQAKSDSPTEEETPSSAENEAVGDSEEENEENGSVEPEGDSPTPPEEGQTPAEEPKTEEEVESRGVTKEELLTAALNSLKKEQERKAQYRERILKEVLQELHGQDVNKEAKRKMFKHLRSLVKER